MIQETTLSGLADRLNVLENDVKILQNILKPRSEPTDIEFVIQIDGDEVWSGVDLLQYYPKILREYPNAQISIGWRSSPVILI